MTGILAIDDMAVLSLAQRGGILTVVSEHDPLLRRFGQCDLIQLQAGETLEILRRQADEVWALVSGAAAAKLEDQREDSPSFESVQALELSGDAPRAVLVPFGVRWRVTARTQAVLVRLSTHEDGANSEDLTP